MDQATVKKLLLETEECDVEFELIFSGKESKKVNGLYKPVAREIIIHNRNFKSDNQLIYTALHEYAHHLRCSAMGGLASPRSHTAEFWATFHRLLEKAEEKGIYENSFKSLPEFDALTDRIKKSYLYENGRIMKEFGKLLFEAQELCKKHDVRFEDYVDRILCLDRTTAKTVMKIYGYNVNPSMGYDNMKVVASLANDDTREMVEADFLHGKSPDTVKAAIKAVRKDQDENPADRLKKEKKRLEKTIAQLEARLKQVDEKLVDLAESDD
jgi:hypothetical protein